MARLVAASLCVLLCAGGTFATTYETLSFNDLVSRADVIFVGEVVDVRAFAIANGRNTAIKTRAVFDVTESLLGAGTTEALEFLGGELNGVELTVAGMPRFQRGDRRVVFARRGPSINPIVGFTQGLLRIAPDQRGVERVLAADGTALGNATLADLRLRIRSTLAQVGRR